MKEVYILKITDAIGEKRLENFSKLLSQISEEYAHVSKGYQELKNTLNTADKLIPFSSKNTKRKIKEQRLAINKLAHSYFGMIAELKKEIRTTAENQMPFKLKFSIQELIRFVKDVTIKEHMSNRELGTTLRRVKITGLEEVYESINHLKTILNEEIGNIYEHCPEKEELIDWVLINFLEKNKLPNRLEKFF